MARDPVLEQPLRGDLAGLDPASLGEWPMFGGLCFPSHGHMTCAGRDGRAMDRVSPTHKAEARAKPGTAAMIHNGRHHAGWVYLNENQLSDNATRARLTARALATVRTLPPKE